MNLKKFYVILCGVMAICLFSIGLVIILGTGFVDNTVDAHSDLKDPLGKILNPQDNNDVEDNIKVVKTFTCLLLGGDRVAENTDTIILANYNPENLKLTLMSIPRDTRLSSETNKMLQNSAREAGFLVDEDDYIIDKINSAYPIGKGKLAKKIVSTLLDIDIDYYVYIDTKVFREIIDLLDGVEYEIPCDMDYDDPLQDLHIHLKKGKQILYGKEAEAFMRFREPNEWNDEILKYYDGSDMKRIQAQQNFIKELLRQKINIKYFTKVSDVIKTFFKNFETDVGLGDVLPYFSLDVLKFDINNDLSFLKLPGQPAYEDNLWYYKFDVQKTKEILDEYFKPEIIIETNQSTGQ